MGNGTHKKELKRLSIDDLRKYKGCEHLTDEQAKEALEAIELLSLLLIKRILGITNTDKHE